MSALDSETQLQAKAIADGIPMMALRLAEKINRGEVRTPVVYAPGMRLTRDQIRSAGIARLETLLKTAREQTSYGKAQGGRHQLTGSGSLCSLIMELVQWSGFKKNLRIDWTDIGFDPVELRELVEHYDLEKKAGVREILQALPAA